MSKFKTMFKAASIAIVASISWVCAALAQMQPGIAAVPLGTCQISAATLAAATPLSSTVCASFTGTGSGTTLTTTSVTGAIKAGQTVTGTGVPAGTTIAVQLTGTTGGAGTYRTSAATTSSGASLTSGGIPPGANMALLQAEVANIRWRDDGAAPTTAIGMLLIFGQIPMLYSGTLSNMQFIAASGSPILDVSFYRTVAP
jgi:hypothetical protein